MITIPNSGQSTKKVKRYTIMHEDVPVIEFNRETDEVIVFCREKLPFGLRGKDKISAAAVSEWLLKCHISRKCNTNEISLSPYIWYNDMRFQ